MIEQQRSMIEHLQRQLGQRGAEVEKGSKPLAAVVSQQPPGPASHSSEDQLGEQKSPSEL